MYDFFKQPNKWANFNITFEQVDNLISFGFHWITW